MPRVAIIMPQLGESIAEAEIRHIHIAVGDSVEADQEIIEVETNKAVMEVTTLCAGTVAEILGEPGVSYAVGTKLGFIEATQEEIERTGVQIEDLPSQSGRQERLRAGSDADPVQGSSTDAGEDGEEEDSNVHFQPTSSAPRPSSPGSQDDIKIEPTVQGLPVPADATGASYLSPRMKARMHELGLNASDLAGVAGSGAGGRVTIEDFEKFISEIEQNRTTPASPMRIAVADSMRRSWTRPLATVGAPVRLDAILDHRRASNPKPGITLYMIRALAVALSENTAIAGRLIGKKIVHPRAIDIGFAVEVEDGVLVPVIRDAEQKTLNDLIPLYTSLVEQALARKLDFAGPPGIATVTNFGTFGIEWATPIPLPEQNLVFGVGAGLKKPVWDAETESWLPQTIAEITLSFDHRILDGGAAGRLLARVAGLLQKPENL